MKLLTPIGARGYQMPDPDARNPMDQFPCIGPDTRAVAEQELGRTHGEYGNNTFWMAPTYAPKFYRHITDEGWAVDLGKNTGDIYNKEGRNVYMIFIDFGGFHEVIPMFDRNTGEPTKFSKVYPEWAIGGKNRRGVRYKPKPK